MPTDLGAARSAYLRSAKDQPVRWYHWGDEAFAAARAEQKPVLLDIGAVWCHWCHVMDHESYENPVVAEILNRDFVCIKVDRDERPDVDARYQRAVQALTGQGGWPLTAFLTPDGDLFYGGTYFPPADQYGRPGFRTVLEQVANAFRTSPDSVATQVGHITEHLTTAEGRTRAGDLTPAVVEQAAHDMARAFDIRYGGFGTQPKFPHPGALDFLLGRWHDTRERWQLDIVARTLTAMARGGIRDQVGGGFHRYAVDARWIVPHFEKMIYDNAELLRTYVHAAGVPALSRDSEAPDPDLVRQVVRDTVAWISSTMADPAGGYYASQDADVGPDDDGDYFTWTPEELRRAVGDDDFDVLMRHYDVHDPGEMRHDPRRNVLWIRETAADIAAATGRTAAVVEAAIASGRDKLRRARGERVRPFVDTTVYTNWSAMTASAMLEAAALLDDEGAGAHALKTLQRLWAEAVDEDGGMRHAIGGEVRGLLDDQAHMAAAVLDAYEATGDPVWRERAAQLADQMWERYWTDRGGLLDKERGRAGQGLLSHEMIPTQDSPTPSANGVAGLVLCRLAEHTGEDHWRSRSIKLLEALAGSAVDLSLFGATLLRAVDWAVHPPTHVVIVGRDDVARALHRTARCVFRPRKVITRLTGDTPSAGLPAPLRAMLDGSAPRAYVCAGTACAEPTADPATLAELLHTFGSPQ